MIGADTRRIVAGVEHEKPYWYRTIGQFPSHAVSGMPIGPHTESTIPAFQELAPAPLPAAIAALWYT